MKRHQTSWTDYFALSKAKPGKDGRQVATCQQGLMKMLLLKTMGARRVLLFGCNRYTVKTKVYFSAMHCRPVWVDWFADEITLCDALA